MGLIEPHSVSTTLVLAPISLPLIGLESTPSSSLGRFASVPSTATESGGRKAITTGPYHKANYLVLPAKHVEKGKSKVQRSFTCGAHAQ